MKNIPNKTIIEMSAVNRLKDSLLRTGRIEPDIRDNDKTPSWDGEIRLYTGNEFSKNNLLGKIPLQVKGTWVGRFQGTSIKYDVDLSDLINYQNDGGAIFFVVQMKDFDRFKIYYRSLLPFDLRRIIASAKEQKTKRVKLELFPQKYCDGMLRIFADFLQNKKKQATLLPNICSMADLKASGMEIEQLEFSIPNIGVESKDDALNQLLNSAPYIYAKPKGLDMSFVVDKFRPEQIITKNPTPIIVNNETLYTGFDVVRKVGGVEEYKIGTDITMTFIEESAHFHYEFKGTLREQISELKFLAALMQQQDVRIGKISLGKTGFKIDGHSLNEILERLSGLEKIQETLDDLHVKKDLNFAKLTDAEFAVLNELVRGVHDNKPIGLSANDNVGFGNLTIGNLKIMLSTKRNKKGRGFFISNFFDNDNLVLSEDEKSLAEGVPICPYVILSADELGTIDNINFTDIVESVKKFSYTRLYGARIVQFILDLLRFYDVKESKDKSVLDAVEGLTDFLTKNDPEREDLYRINYLQTEKRKRTLTSNEIQYLMTLKVPGMPLEYQVAASILLESFSEAQAFYEQLDKEAQEEFDNYPICSLWKGKC